MNLLSYTTILNNSMYEFLFSTERNQPLKMYGANHALY